MRSRTGCLTCRRRKLKCDEKKPTCGQCRKASRECVPNAGVVFRHQHNASMNGEDPSDEKTLKGFYAYKNTFDDDSVWLDVPKQENFVFINTTNPYLDPQTPDETVSNGSIEHTVPVELRSNPCTPAPYPTCEPHLASAQKWSATSQFAPTPDAGTPISPVISFSNRTLQSLSDDAVMTPSPIDPSLSSRYDSISSPAPRHTSAHSNSDTSAEQAHEIAYLLRWFSEGPGYWMDLFDFGKYFALYVPVKARQNPLLKYAAVAYAAKSLARVHGRKPVAGGNVTRQGRIELYPDADSVDWSHKAAQYYDTAVTLLLETLKNDSAVTLNSKAADQPGAPNYDRTYDPGGPVRQYRHPQDGGRFKSNTEELLAASAILSVYEFLDASVFEWAKHLNGAKSLLELAQERMTSSMASASTRFVSKARRSTFWNIARQDMLAAFINNTHTRLDSEDLSLWREAGLLIDENGFISPSNTTESGYPEGEHVMKEDMICNALVWIMAMLVNFIAAGDELPTDSGAGWTGTRQRSLLDCWYYLRRHMETWYDGLPLTFQPCARVDPTRIPSSLLHDDDDFLFPEVWFSIPMCASAMQCYHMSQILLYMNKPHESAHVHNTGTHHLSPYQSVMAACENHSREIIGISLARPDDAVRIHSTQPLFTAGQCLSDARERRVVLKLLRAIETDTGWATDYRARQLIQHWQTET